MWNSCFCRRFHVIVVLLLEFSWKRFAHGHGLDPFNSCRCDWTIDLWETSPIKIEVPTSKRINKTLRRDRYILLHSVTPRYTHVTPCFSPPYTLLYSLSTLLNHRYTLIHLATHCYIHVTPRAEYRIQICVSLFFSVLLLLQNIMDFTVHKLGGHVECTWLSFQF